MTKAFCDEDKVHLCDKDELHLCDGELHLCDEDELHLCDGETNCTSADYPNTILETNYNQHEPSQTSG